MLTIQQFAEKTGLPPSTLRFYDKKKLLIPARLENGYRAYSESQISDALLIHSLRNADIEIEEIKCYLIARKDEREQLVSKWKKAIKTKLSALSVAEQYLGGISPNEKHIHLVRWDEPVEFIWHKHTVKRKLRSFHKVAAIDLASLKEKGYKLAPGFYIRTLESKGYEITGEVGFIIQSSRLSSSDRFVVKMEPTLFASMECSAENEFLCFQFIQMIRQYGFKPNGLKLEKYDDFDSPAFHYLIPLSN